MLLTLHLICRNKISTVDGKPKIIANSSGEGVVFATLKDSPEKMLSMWENSDYGPQPLSSAD